MYPLQSCWTWIPTEMMSTKGSPIKLQTHVDVSFCGEHLWCFSGKHPFGVRCADFQTQTHISSSGSACLGAISFRRHKKKSPGVIWLKLWGSCRRAGKDACECSIIILYTWLHRSPSKSLVDIHLAVNDVRQRTCRSESSLGF